MKSPDLASTKGRYDELDDLTPIEIVSDKDSDDQEVDKNFTVAVAKKGYGFLRPNKFYSAK